tara:strand:+ start:106 stop:888 length:783 start_codon:yes stop_codon:yes gene_type:complete
MKKYFVIGNPIEHSLSPKLHNYWINENKIKATYEKKQLNESDLKRIVDEIKLDKINGINVTIPFKKAIIPFLDYLTPLAQEAQSVNTVLKKDNKIIGDNTDIGGFQESIKNINYNVKDKKIFILGAGGVAPSIIIALKKLGASKIALSNRTKEKAEVLKNIYSGLEIVDWGQTPDFDMIINATSLGLKENDEIKLNYQKIGKNKLFYDVIYSSRKTNFLTQAQQSGSKIENGKMMFIYQAQLAFKIWHNILPKITENLLN